MHERFRELTNKRMNGEASPAELRELELLESMLVSQLTLEERMRTFKAACKMLGVKPSQIIGGKENVP
jgi:hypothetical protein